MLHIEALAGRPALAARPPLHAPELVPGGDPPADAHASRRLDGRGLPPSELDGPGRGTIVLGQELQQFELDARPLHGPGAVVHGQGAEPFRLLFLEVVARALVDDFQLDRIVSGHEIE